MKSRTYFLSLSLLLLCGTQVRGQNLVPNPNFEDYITCPLFGYLENYCVGWTTIGGTPDYFNRCADDTASVPWNFAGYQEPRSGDGYLGLITAETMGLSREMARCQLLEPLQPGQPVYISLWAAAGGFGNDEAALCKYASNGLGVKFSVQAQVPVTLWPGNVALTMEAVLQDTSIWYHVSGTYVPDSAYGWLNLGGFIPTDEMTFVILDTSIQASDRSYAFIDDVCVSTDPYYCDLYSGVSEGNKDEFIGAYLTGDGGLIVSGLSSATVATHLSLVDMHGHWISLGVVPPHSDRQHFQLPSMADGIYILCLENSSGRNTRIKLAIVSP